nr:hypothetical protein [Tanacetum cinerariifolium]
MADKEKKSTMKGFATNDQADYYSGITSITDKLIVVVFPISLVGDAWRWLDGNKGINYYLDIDLLTKDIEGFKTYDVFKDDVPWVHEKPWTNYRAWKKPAPVKHCCKPFNYKTGCSEWPTCSWRNDGYRNRGNFPGAYIIEISLNYQDHEWYEALEDEELKEEALRNKAIIEGIIDEDYE